MQPARPCLILLHLHLSSPFLGKDSTTRHLDHILQPPSRRSVCLLRGLGNSGGDDIVCVVLEEGGRVVCLNRGSAHDLIFDGHFPQAQAKMRQGQLVWRFALDDEGEAASAGSVLPCL